MTLLKNHDIKKALKKCKPRKIAVAYIGIDWKNFIDPKMIDEIIISPTIGSNPYAIEDLANNISWDKIHFLENLHAKFYIGDTFAILGSANLSKNGIDINGLDEASVKIGEKSLIQDLEKYFEELKEKSHQYSEDQKKEIISKLKEKWETGKQKNIITSYNANKVPSFYDYEPLSKDDFYIVWYYDLYNDRDYKYSDEINDRINDIENATHFSKNDKIKTGKWILFWKANKKNHKINPEWLYIDKIYKKAVTCKSEKEYKDSDKYTYTTVGVMWKQKHLSPPFDLDKQTIEAFRKTVQDKEFDKSFTKGITDNHEFCISNDTFCVSDTFPYFKDFITKMKKNYKKPKSE